MKNLTPEMITKAKTAKTAEELLALAKANGVELTEKEAKTYFEQLSAIGAVSDDELDAVAGGACGNDGEETEEETTDVSMKTCPHCRANIPSDLLTCPVCKKALRPLVYRD